MNMKSIRKLHFKWILLLAVGPPVALAAPGDGLTGTGHDFAGLGTPATGLCTFCHTPHKAQSQALLWNHDLSTNNFTWTETATTAGTTYPSFVGNTYNGSTAKCLSCHDGSVAVGDIGWWDAQVPVNLDTTLHDTDEFNIASTGGSMDGNHPVAMPFPFNNVASTYNGQLTGAGIVLADWKADPQTAGIRLFTDDGSGGISAGATAGQTGIECSSCHDPHNGAAVQGDYLLRGLLGGSTADYICIKCHTKE